MFLVTGGAGFIGSNIAQALVEQGETVRVFDNLSTGKQENMAPFAGHAEFVHGDLRDPEAVKKAVAGVRYILHQGALPSVPASVQDPVGTTESNINGTLNLLVAARDAGVSRVVFASSSAIYGDDPELPKQETMLPRPLSPYALHKLTGEHFCAQFTALYGLETVSLRYFNVFGKRQDPDSLYAAVIPKFLQAILSGKQPTIFGDGEQTRDFIFIDDVVKANLTALKAPKAAGQVMNVASGEKLSLNRLIAVLEIVLGRSITPVYADEREGDIKHSVADVSRAKALMDFEVTVPFQAGLEKYVAWFKENGLK